MRTFYVYILSNTAMVIYIGVTSNLEGRFWEHTEERSSSSSKFCLRYNLHKLVFYEDYPTARDAIAREKQLKGWRREKKIALIESMNPAWKDLSGRLRI
jgi:putative endonuclease